MDFSIKNHRHERTPPPKKKKKPSVLDFQITSYNLRCPSSWNQVTMWKSQLLTLLSTAKTGKWET